MTENMSGDLSAPVSEGFHTVLFVEFDGRTYMSIGKVKYSFDRGVERTPGVTKTRYAMPWKGEIECACGRGTFLVPIRPATHLIEHWYDDPVKVRIFRGRAAAKNPTCSHWTLISNAELVIRRER